MGKLRKIYSLVWYGDCENPDCQDMELSQFSDDIEYVFQVSNVNSGWKHWSSALSDLNLSDFSALVCCVPYIIKLKSADGETPIRELEIQDVIVGRYAQDSDDSTDLRITQECPGPPGPVICCEGLGLTAAVVNGSIEAVDNVSGNFSENGTLCFNSFGGASGAIPPHDSIFACPFEVADWSRGGGVIVVSGELSTLNEDVSFTKSDGTCYRTKLTDREGVNILYKV